MSQGEFAITQHNSESLHAICDQLKEELEREHDGHSDHGVDHVQHLASIENRLQELYVQALKDAGGDGLQETQSLLREVLDWTELTEKLQLGEAAIEANGLGLKLAKDVVVRWRELAQSLACEANPEIGFLALMQTTTIELGAVRCEKRMDQICAQLSEIRQVLREKLIQAIAAQPPNQDIKDRWVLQLADRAAAILSELPELNPALAARQLLLVLEDIRWHAGNVEKAPGARWRRLSKSCRKLRAEWQERVLQSRLESRFGRPVVAAFEVLVFWSLFAVVGLLAVEGIFELNETAQFWIVAVDTAICGIFLLEFFIKLLHAPARGLWFVRHFVIDLLPSIPFGLIGMHFADPARAGRLARLLRLPRLARYLRLARTFVRVFRVIGFLTRGMDRLARRYGPLLNRNVILYPTPEERLKLWAQQDTLAADVRRLRAVLAARWRQLLLLAKPQSRTEIAQARLNSLQAAYRADFAELPSHLGGGQTGVQERIAEKLIRDFSVMSPHDTMMTVGNDLIRPLARVVRIAARPPLRWFPLVSYFLPTVSKRNTDAEVVAAAARKIGTVFGRWYYYWYWWCDLYGTITPTQFVDRVGSFLMRSSMRPAYRLTMFGIIFVLIELVLNLTGLELLRPLRQMVYQLLGLPFILLGALCAVAVGLGFWMQRLAKEATDLYAESATAQFLHLTEIIRPRYLERDAKVFCRRVLLPEQSILNAGENADEAETELLFIQMTESWLIGRHVPCDSEAAFDPVEQTVLLYRDSLDGALLANSDTRTTSQLLGNPALRKFRTWSRRFNKPEERSLQALSLTRQKTLFGGPYLWFTLITQAISHLTARLIFEYNRNAIPLEELAEMPEENRAKNLKQMKNWLDSKQLDYNFAKLERKEDQYAYVVTTAFTALHFLDGDPKRDEEVEKRFGPEVLQRLKRDRSQLFRRVFGTYPLHRLSKDQRAINIYAAYKAWLGGGRVLLLPIFLAWQGVRLLGMVLRWLVYCIKEIRKGQLHYEPQDASDSDYVTAVRKIDRMRGPVVRACIRLRALMDPEYLGVPLPGMDVSTTPRADFIADQEFLNLEPGFLDQMEHEKLRAETDMARLKTLIDGGLLERAAAHAGRSADAFATPEHVRAAAVVYLADYLQIRPLISAQEILHDVYRSAAAEAALPMRPWPSFATAWKFRRYWREHGFGGWEERRAAWRATIHNSDGVAHALRIWHRAADALRTKGEKQLGRVLQHPSRITEALVTLRAVQTLSVLDVLHYRQHVYDLGDYAGQGEEWRELLKWGSCEE